MDEQIMETEQERHLALMEEGFLMNVSGRGDMSEHYLDMEAAKQAQIKAIKYRAGELCGRLARELEWLKSTFGQAVEKECFDMVLEQSGKKKSINFLTGTAGFRTLKDKLVIDDMRALLDWATHPENATSVQPEDYVGKVDVRKAVAGMSLEEVRECATDLKVTPFGDYFGETGEIPPGCHIEKGSEKFYTKPNKLKLGERHV